MAQGFLVVRGKDCFRLPSPAWVGRVVLLPSPRSRSGPRLTHRGSGCARIPTRWRRGRARERVAPAPAFSGVVRPARVNPGGCAR